MKLRTLTYCGTCLFFLVGRIPGAPAQDAASPVPETWELASPKLQEDYPDMCLDADGTAWVVYLAYNGKADTLKVARKTKAGLKPVGNLAGPGVMHQPVIACDGSGVTWAIWSELNRETQSWSLKARRIAGGKIQPGETVIEDQSGSAFFADAGTDRSGRVWVTW